MPILYHIGRYPMPRPHKKLLFWYRNGKQYPDGIFLTDKPWVVCVNHGIKGTVYAVEVPMGVIKQCGGIKKYDFAREIIIPTNLWHLCKVLGKSCDEKTLQKKTLHAFSRTWAKQRCHDITGRQRMLPAMYEGDLLEDHRGHIYKLLNPTRLSKKGNYYYTLEAVCILQKFTTHKEILQLAKQDSSKRIGHKYIYKHCHRIYRQHDKTWFGNYRFTTYRS